MSSEFVKSNHLKRVASVVWKPMKEETILLNTENGAYFSTNDVGLAIWQACDGTRSLEDIVIEVADQFKAPLAQIKRDIQSFSGRLQRLGLLETSSR